MLHPDGVEVYIKSLDSQQPFKEYVNPGLKDSSKKMERFIDVEGGERFSIVVRTTESFNFFQADGLKIGFNIDRRAVSVWQFRDKLDMKTKVFEKVQAVQNIDGRLMKAGFSFGHLILDEDLYHDDQTLRHLTTNLGRIRVNIRRGHQTKLAVPKPRRAIEEADTTSSKQVIKTAGITECMRPDLNGAEEVIPLNGFTFEPLQGPGAETLTFTFRYRSRMTLERLNIIPMLASNGTAVTQAAPETNEAMASLDTSDSAIIPSREHSTVPASGQSSTADLRPESQTTYGKRKAVNESSEDNDSIPAQQSAPQMATSTMERVNLIDLTVSEDEIDTRGQHVVDHARSAEVKAEPSDPQAFSANFDDEEEYHLNVRLLENESKQAEIEKKKIELDLARMRMKKVKVA